MPCGHHTMPMITVCVPCTYAHERSSGSPRRGSSVRKDSIGKGWQRHHAMPKHSDQPPQPNRINQHLKQHRGFEPCKRRLSLAMRRHYIGSKCHVLIMGVRIDSPCMALSHNVTNTRQGHRTMPGIPQLSHASALYRQQMPRAYHGCSRWQPLHGAQSPLSRFALAPGGHKVGASNHA